MKIFPFIIFSFLFHINSAFSQVTLFFQGNEIGNSWNFTTTGASGNALAQANLAPNYVSGTKSIVVGGNTGGGSCYEGGSGNGTSIDNKITFQSVNISTSNESIRTLTFSWGSRSPECTGTGWDFNENLKFTPVIDGVSQTPITIAVGNNNSNFNIQLAAQNFTYTIPTCVNTFAFELMLPTNRRDELLFVDDVKLTAPNLNTPFALAFNITGDAAVCSGNSSSVTTNSIPGVIYEWSGLPAGASFTTPNNTASSNSMTIDWGNVNPGTYQVKLKPKKVICGNAVYGQETSFQVTLENNPTLITSPSISICSGEAITLTVNGANSYLWNNNLGTNNSISISPTATTTYQVTGFNGICSSSSNIVVTVNPAAISAGIDIVVCQGSSVTLSATGGNNYSWDQGIVDGVPFTPTTTGIYTVTSNGPCAGTDEVLVTVEEIPVIDFTSDINEGCLPLEVQFENLTTGNNTYQWNFGDGNTSTISSPNHIFTSIGCKNITVIATSANGCTNTWIKDNFICVNPLPNIQFTTNTDQIGTENSTVEFTNESTNATTFTWNFGDGNFNNEFSAIHIFDPYSLENQLVTLIGTNDFGCVDSAKTIIYFAAIPSIYVPNAFSPNGDEFNQIFKPAFGDGIDPTKYHLSIYNRWGELIFETQDVTIGWDGSYKGSAVPVGEYIWKMRYGIIEGVDQIERVGHVNLIL